MIQFCSNNFRYFKCKRCNYQMYTLDKIYPTSVCQQCGFEKFDTCGMKVEDTSIVNRETKAKIDRSIENNNF
jgi:DNA-directed RNA polymerase subunit RPC12/RpoP